MIPKARLVAPLWRRLLARLWRRTLTIRCATCARYKGQMPASVLTMFHDLHTNADKWERLVREESARWPRV